MSTAIQEDSTLGWQQPGMALPPYAEFFGLREPPFDLVPNPRFLYLTARGRAALSDLRYGLTNPKGLMMLVGEVGAGKTTLVQTLMAEFDSIHVEGVLVSNPTLTRAELFEFLAASYKLSDEAASSKARFLIEFRSYLTARQEAGRLTALILDEAQSLSGTLLEEVRLLSNIETPSAKLLNVLLVGQPELALRLNEPALWPLKQRIALRCRLASFTFRETATYVATRLRTAGGSPADVFSREAIAVIHDATQGVPRMINVVCDNALNHAFGHRVKPVTRALVEAVLRDFEVGEPPLNEVPEPEVNQVSEVSGPTALVESRQNPAEVPGAVELLNAGERATTDSADDDEVGHREPEPTSETTVPDLPERPERPMFDLVTRNRRFFFLS